jgi:hypothetical protein
MTTLDAPTPPPLDALLAEHRVVLVVVADDVGCAARRDPSPPGCGSSTPWELR